MVLYCAGASLNFIIHVIVSIVKSDEPGFFVGYDNAGAIMVVLSNVFIGLAITAVYKCKLPLSKSYFFHPYGYDRLMLAIQQ